MANLNKVMLIGRLTRDPECRAFSNGGKVAKFGFAVNNRAKNSQTGQWEDVTVWLDCEAYNRGDYGKLADRVERPQHPPGQPDEHGRPRLVGHEALADRHELGRIVGEHPDPPGALGDQLGIGHVAGTHHVAQVLHRVHGPTLARWVPTAAPGRPDEARREGGALLCAAVAPDARTPALTDVTLSALAGDSRPLAEWLTTFPLLLAVVDPYTIQSSWILDTARRVLRGYFHADVRVAWLVTADAEGTRSFLGPLADEFLTFSDADRSAVAGLGLDTLPALVLVKQNLTISSSAQGWDPDAWRRVAEDVGDLTGWTVPAIPAAGDPSAYPGTPAR